MIKILLPINKTKTDKPTARGLWYDKNKLYYDYLQVIKTPKIDKHILNAYCKFYNQLALFFIIKNEGYLYTKETAKIDRLPLKITYYKTIKTLKSTLKNLLKKYNGLTIYKLKNRYKIVVFYK